MLIRDKLMTVPRLVGVSTRDGSRLRRPALSGYHAALAERQMAWIGTLARLSIRTGLATDTSRFPPARGKHGHDFDPS